MDRTASATATDDAAFYGDSGTPATTPALKLDCALPGAFLRGMLATACQDETRFHLNAIYFHGLHAITTDGHTLTRASVLPVEGREDRDYLIAADVIRGAVKMAGSRGTVEVWTNGKRGDACKGEFRVYGPVPARSSMIRGHLIGRLEWRTIQGATFPPYEQVIPAFDASPALVDSKGRDIEPCEESQRIVGHGVNPRYLARMADVLEGIDDAYGTTPLVLRACRGSLDPIAYTAHVRVASSLLGTTEWERRMVTFVIMPMRVSADDYADADAPAKAPPKTTKGGKAKAK